MSSENYIVYKVWLISNSILHLSNHNYSTNLIHRPEKSMHFVCILYACITYSVQCAHILHGKHYYYIIMTMTMTMNDNEN